MTTREITFWSISPELTLVQLLPLLVERKTPPPVAAKRFVEPAPPEAGETAKALIVSFVNPAAVQLAPLLVDRKTPPKVPRKILPVETAKASTTVPAGNPELIPVQFAPLLVERKTLSLVPAKIFRPETAKAPTKAFDGNPEFTAVQPVPLLVDKKTPPPLVPAKIFAPEASRE